MPASECELTLSFVGRGEARTIRCAHCSSPVASSKPEFSLPTMNRRLPAYVSAGCGSALGHARSKAGAARLGGSRVDVVRHEIEAGRVGLEGMRHAHGEDRDLAAVVAVSGVQHEALAV